MTAVPRTVDIQFLLESQWEGRAYWTVKDLDALKWLTRTKDELHQHGNITPGANAGTPAQLERHLITHSSPEASG
ncbi:hypothetical protein AB0J68_02785 [Micromonospora sp. NPDC049580]|uniref:hypothetical protein n=1 Tax=Micromonospora sp. NPDC049580 TaxID=3154832 RepID=UPI0034153368